MELNYNWTLKDAKFTKDKGTVFSCFACGGGSTMGYKLAGFDVIGCNEIDPKMIGSYKINHNPKYAYLEPIQTFKLRKDLPEDLYNLDILDGSPPCSSFSMAGNRGDDWGKEKKFREGQAEQVLDTLFFDFIDLAKKLQPKIVVAENVKGLLLGEARNYVRRILKEFDKAGYYVVYNLLDASTMGVPQRRERVFFTAIRKDLAKNILRPIDMFTEEPYLKLVFNEKPIFFKDFYKPNGENDRPITAKETLRLWNLRQVGDSDLGDAALREGSVKFWNHKFLNLKSIPLTFPSGKDSCYLFDEPRKPNKYEVCCIGSFPQDYNFNQNDYAYLIGMSVPPLMTARLANEIYNQWLTKIK
jgi:DNA (cytosine-5)-methyltransferase 1